jgi:hypothetical protein
MTRIQRPLNRDAVRAADDELYRRHEDDPRPNALYAEDGTRRPLDASDPDQAALRQEWCDLYRAEATPEATKPPPKAPADPPSDRAVAEPVQGCPNTHWIALKLAPAPDAGARERWWPARPPGYSGVGFAAELTNGRRESSFGSDGLARFDGIPAGTCGFELAKFYADVEAALVPA